MPQGVAILAPITGVLPAGQRFTGIPLALTVVLDATGGKMILHGQEQAVGQGPFLRTVGGGVPFRRFHVVHRDKGGLPPHGQPYVIGHQFFVHLIAQSLNIQPLAFGVGLGDPGIFMDTIHPVFKLEFHLALAG